MGYVCIYILIESAKIKPIMEVAQKVGFSNVTHIQRHEEWLIAYEHLTLSDTQHKLINTSTDIYR